MRSIRQPSRGERVFTNVLREVNMDKTKHKIMSHILNEMLDKPLSVFVARIDKYVELFGEESRDFYIATLWETYHLVSMQA